MFVYVPHVCSIQGGHKRESDLLGTAVQMVVNYLVGAGNRAGPLEKQLVILIIEPSIWPHF